MTRPTYRRSPRLENLEKREVLSGPSAQQQYMLELLNQARTNPSAAADRVASNLNADIVATLNYYNVDINAVKNTIANAAVQPALAWNDQLAQTATSQSQYQADTGTQTHSGPNGIDLQGRLDQVGYTNRTSDGENAYAYSTSADEAMQAFLIDWGVSSNGHRDNILQPNTSASQAYRDVGVGIVASNKPGFGPLVITQDFGAQANEQAQLLGVAYNDPNHTEFYAPGQGRSDVTIDATNVATGQTSETHTLDAGGYQMALAPGNYAVTARVGSQIIRSQNVTVGTTNVKVDYDLSDAWQGGTYTPPGTPVPAPASAPAPAPAAAPAPTVVTPPPATNSIVTNAAPQPTTPPPTPPTPTPTPTPPTPTPPVVTQTVPQVTTPTTSTTQTAGGVSSIFKFSWITSWKTYASR